MKLFKNTLAIAALFTIGSTGAKNIGAKKASTPARYTGGESSTSASKADTQPATQGQSYNQLRAQVLGMSQANVIDSTKKLNDMFINKMAQAVTDAGLDGFALRGILETARDKFVPFTSKNNDDYKLLLAIQKQIDDSVGFLREFSSK